MAVMAVLAELTGTEDSAAVVAAAATTLDPAASAAVAAVVTTGAVVAFGPEAPAAQPTRAAAVAGV